MTEETIATEQRFIVAEITKSWNQETPVKDLLCQRFELVINANVSRGYRLIDWKCMAVTNGHMLTETIIAIFEKENK